MLRLAIAFTLFLAAHVWAADNLDQCDFNKSNGACSSVVNFDEATGSYSIPATGSCRTVTVLIDGTQYPHKMKDQDVTDSVMRLDKTKTAKVSVSGCTSHPTLAKVEVEAKNASAISHCESLHRPELEACEPAGFEKLTACLQGGGASPVCLNETNAFLRDCQIQAKGSYQACLSD